MATNPNPYEPVVSKTDYALLFVQAPSNPWFHWLDRAMHMYYITASRQVAAFLATMAFESRNLAAMEEDLCYTTEQRLCKVWPSRFALSQVACGPKQRIAHDYINNQQKLAEFVYGGRMGNGPEGSGDGWKYRGRGPGHITGKDNYMAIAKNLGIDCIKNPNLLGEPQWGSISCAYLWTEVHRCTILDTTDLQFFKQCVWRWNGGETDMENREKTYVRFCEVLKC